MTGKERFECLVSELPKAPNHRAALERHHEQGKRRRYRGEFVETRFPRGGPVQRVLLSGVTDVKTGETVADHVWMEVEILDRLRLRDGEELRCRSAILFNALAEPYVKGDWRYEGRSVDYKLVKPSHVFLEKGF